MGEAEPPQTRSGEAKRQIYQDYLRQIEVEDTLASDRLNWMLTFQGFLFAAFGFASSGSASDQSQFLRALPFVGVLIAFLGFCGVLAAKIAADSKSRQWRAWERENGFDAPRFLSGPIAWHLSITPTLGIPLVLLGFWTWVCLSG